MSVFSTLFSPIGKWRENPNREGKRQGQSAELRSIDKVEEVAIEGIREINISSNTNVIISATQRNKITVRIRGTSSVNYQLNAYVTQIDKMLHIHAKGNSLAEDKRGKPGSDESSRLANLPFVSLTLEIEVPEHSEIKKIKVKNSNGEVICKSRIIVESIDVINKNGNIQISSIFKNANISAKNGNIMVRTKANSDIHIDISNADGSVGLYLENVRYNYMQYEISGACLINPRYEGGFSAYGKVSVNSGSFIYS